MIYGKLEALIKPRDINFKCSSESTAAVNEIRLSAMNKQVSEDCSSDYKRNEQQEMLVAPPLDLSFKKATSMNGT